MESMGIPLFRICPLILVAGVLALTGCSREQHAPETTAGKNQQTMAMTDSLWLVVEYAAEDADTFSLFHPGSDTLTVQKLLVRVTDRQRINLEIERYAFGAMITTIRDRTNGAGGYWLYTVNSKPVPKAASAHQLTPGDTVRFFFTDR